jgi:hypothetical protein
MIRRFSLTKDRHVIDVLDPANTGRVYILEGEPEDESHLREHVLWRRLDGLLDKLIINPNPKKPAEEYQRWSRKSEQGDKWSFCLTAGTLCPANQERP